MMRDRGFAFQWYDKYCQNLFAKHFERKEDYYDIVTAFELFEHFAEPMEEIERLLHTGKTLIFSTELVPKTSPKVRDWWYYAPETGQHISFYTEKSLRYIAETFHKCYTGYRSIHILSDISINGWNLKLCCRCAPLIHMFLRRRSLVAEDFQRISGRRLNA